MPEEQEGSTEDDFRAASTLSFLSYCCLFILAARKLPSGESRNVSCVIVASVLPPRPRAADPNSVLFFLFFVRVFLPSPLLVLSDTENFSSPLVPAPPLLSHNPLLRSFSFSFFRSFSFSVPGIDRVTRQQWGSQFRPRSLSTPWISASTLFAPNGFIK